MCELIVGKQVQAQENELWMFGSESVVHVIAFFCPKVKQLTLPLFILSLSASLSLSGTDGQATSLYQIL